jgi:PAS domain S-box-containing protein
MKTKPTYEELENRINDLESKLEEFENIQYKLEMTKQNQDESRLLNPQIWLENSPVCTKIVDIDFNLQYMSNSGIKELKIDDIAKYYGQPYPLHFYPDSFKIPMTDNLGRAKETGEIIVQEASIVDTTGEIMWYNSTLIPVKDDTGQLDYIMVVSLDTTERKRAEEKLMQTNKNLQKAKENAERNEIELQKVQKISHVGSWYLDLATNQVTWTEELYKMYGFDPSLPPPLLTNSQKLFTSESWELLSNSIEKCSETGISYEIELKTIRKDGSNGWMWAHGEAIKDKNNKIIALWGAVQDITKRKQAELELKESEEKFSKAFNINPNSLAIIDLKTKERVAVNDCFAKITGHSKETLMGNTLGALGEIDMGKVEMAIKSIKNGISLRDVEVKVKHKSGSEMLMLYAIEGIKIGNRNCMIVSGKDITEQKKAEQELIKAKEKAEENEQKFRDFANSVTDIYFALDKDLNYIFWNKACEISLGYKNEDVIGKNWKSFDFNKDYDWIADKYKKIINTKKAESFDGIFEQSDNKLYFTIHAYPTTSGLVVYLQNITEKKNIELELINKNIEYEVLNKELSKTNEELQKAKEKAEKSEKELQKAHDVLEQRVKERTVELSEVNEQLNLEIDERKQTEIELKKAKAKTEENELKFRDFFNNSPVGTFVVDVNEKLEYTFNSINPFSEDLIGISNKEIQGRSLSILKEKYGDETMNYVADLYNKIALSKKTHSFEEEVKLHDKTLYLNTTIRPIINEFGRVIRLIGTNLDISNFKKAELQIRTLSAAVEHSPTTIVITDTKGNIEYANPKFTELTGYSLQEIKGINTRILSSGKTDKEDIKQLWETIKSGKIWQGEFINKKKNGDEFIESASISPVFSEENKVLNYVAIKEDITERKQAEQIIKKQNEQLAELNATKDKLFSIIGHDLRGPIGSLKSFLELLISGDDLADTKKLISILQMLADSANATFELLENLLSWANSQQNETIFAPEKLELKAVYNLTIQLFIELTKKKQIKVIDNIPDGIFVFADRNMLMLVFRNLISNAIKFTPSGKQIQIFAEKQVAEYIITIKDEGIGINSENLSKLFKDTETFTTYGTNGEKGTGLGLSLCKEFVEKHGGKIWVESEIGIGSSFSFTIPYKLGNSNKNEDVNYRNNNK